MAIYINEEAFREYEERNIQPFVTAAVSSYLKHFPDMKRATAAAEADVLGMAMDAIEHVLADDESVDKVRLRTLAECRAVIAWKVDQ